VINRKIGGGLPLTFRRPAIFSLALALGLAPVNLASVNAYAQGHPGLIRDAEIEATIRAYADPLFSAAGLDASVVEVHLVNSNQINAFVAGGMQLFINTGLLMRAQSPNQVIGVIAHETGHIEGGHLVRFREELRNATIESILGLVLAAGAGVAAGNAGIGMGGVTLGNEIVRRNMLQYSRVQESAADQAGLHLLDETHQSARGLMEFFQILGGQEMLLAANQEPYLRTHPLTQDRIAAVERHVAESPYSDAKDSEAFTAMHQRMLAKLKGFLWPLNRVLQDYPETDQSVAARYARSIAYFRVSRLQEALALIDGLIAEAPEDAFFIEQKAQFLFENGRLQEALPLYQKALDRKPLEPLLRLELAQVQVETEDPALIKPAVRNLEEATRYEPNNPQAWQLLAVAYGRDGQLGMSALAQAEEAMARGQRKEAALQAERALKGLPDGSPGWLRAQDILSSTDANTSE